MTELTSGLVHPAIASVAVDALARLGVASDESGRSAPVRTDVQRSRLTRIMELGGPPELLLAGRKFKRFHEFPLFLVLLNSDSIPVLLDKIAQLNKYFHSHHRHVVREEGDRVVELDHVSVRGPAPEPVESLFVSGLYLAVMEQIGSVGVCAAFPQSASDGWVYSDGETREVPRDGTARWRFEWGCFEARQPLPGLDEMVLENPGKDLEKSSLADRVSFMVDRDLTRHWRLDRIASELMMSPRTLQRRLQAEGTTLTEVLVERRLANARRLLTETSRSITEIGYMLGFTDTPHFTRTFSAAMGVPPSRWRESLLEVG